MKYTVYYFLGLLCSIPFISMASEAPLQDVTAYECLHSRLSDSSGSSQSPHSPGTLQLSETPPKAPSSLSSSPVPDLRTVERTPNNTVTRGQRRHNQPLLEKPQSGVCIRLARYLACCKKDATHTRARSPRAPDSPEHGKRWWHRMRCCYPRG